MNIFEPILVLLVAVLVSMALKQFVPFVSLAAVQIFLGTGVGFFFHSFTNFEIDPNFFFCLFVAPLLFCEAKNAEKVQLVKYGREIFLFAFVLVFINVVVIGLIFSSIFEAIPLPVAFALAAALGPTDAVAVNSLKAKLTLPKKTNAILLGESLVNDASGIISFQFAIGAAMTGAFSLKEASIELIYVAFGGIAVGLFYMGLIYLLIKWLRKIGIDTPAFHTLIEILIPFVIYLICEEFHTSGILGVVTAGIVYSFIRPTMSPTQARFKIASTTTWEMITTVFNGLVFIILGIQIIEIVLRSRFEVILLTAFMALIVTLCIYAIRFIWSLFWVGKSRKFKERAFDAGLLSVGGVRGAVALATMFSTPLFLADGVTPFPYRDELFLTISIVILYTMLTANISFRFFLKEEDDTIRIENVKAEIRVLLKVVRNLNSMRKPNNMAVAVVISEYKFRIHELQESIDEHPKNSKMQLAILRWQKEAIYAAVKAGKIHPQIAYSDIRRLNSHALQLTYDKANKRQFKKEMRHIRRNLYDLYPNDLDHSTGQIKRDQAIKDLKILSHLITDTTLEHLYEVRTKIENDDSQVTDIDKRELEILISEWEARAERNWEIKDDTRAMVDAGKQEYRKIAIKGFSFERNALNDEQSKGNITGKEYTRCLQNISLMELSLRE